MPEGSRRPMNRFVQSLAAALLLAGCGDAGGEGFTGDRANVSPSCTPGETFSCACTDGTSGTQACLPDGTLETCTCGASSAGAAGSGGNGGAPSAGVGGSPTAGGGGGTAGVMSSGGSSATGGAGTTTSDGGVVGSGGTGGVVGSGGTGGVVGSGGLDGSGGLGGSGGFAGDGGSGGSGGTEGSGGSTSTGGSGGFGGSDGTGGAGNPDDPFDALRQACVDHINMYRATLGLEPYERAEHSVELCSDDGAEQDATTGQAHSSSGNCAGMSAQNTCPGWDPSYYGGEMEALLACLDVMWAEGEPPVPRNQCIADYQGCFLDHGHYMNMSNESYEVVSCGFYRMPNGDLWMNQDFGQ